MDSQEALNKLVKASCPNCDGEGCKGCSIEKICNCEAKYWIDRIQRDIDKAKKYDEKETPKKVLNKHKEYYYADEEDMLPLSTITGLCPTCNHSVEHDKYCPRCSQKLDWSDTEDE